MPGQDHSPQSAVRTESTNITGNYKQDQLGIDPEPDGNAASIGVRNGRGEAAIKRVYVS